eukprot:GHVU01202080.1.p1 GENE.GHVU01202080.1~~GHVU01202080.1.p1  ORF type:complete len:195 (-),score=31.21 GHVU01202080.1:293-877(-)
METEEANKREAPVYDKRTEKEWQLPQIIEISWSSRRPLPNEAPPADGDVQYCKEMLFFTSAYPACYTEGKPEALQRRRCEATGAPARYFDPLTRFYYADAAAFRTLRERYYLDRDAERERVLSGIRERLKQLRSKLRRSSSPCSSSVQSASAVTPQAPPPLPPPTAAAACNFPAAPCPTATPPAHSVDSFPQQH